MSLRKELLKEIAILEGEIKELEIKRSRSEASLLEALISRREPDEEEARFFRQYTADIEVKREKLTILKKKLALLDKQNKS